MNGGIFMSNEKMQELDCPWCGRGASLDITGCRFVLCPMSDRYIDIILDAVKKVDTQKVWHTTDKLSTIYRGKRVHVVDAAKACFVNAYQQDVHMVMEATFSKGCPGDTDADSFLSEDDTLLNQKNIADKHFPVLCKFAFYPMGMDDYIRHVAYVANLAISRGVYLESSHYATVLHGDVHAVFDYFNEVMEYAEKNISHYILEATLSVNSPTK